MELNAIVNRILKNKELTLFCVLLSIFFIYKFGESVGEFLYYLLN